MKHQLFQRTHSHVAFAIALATMAMMVPGQTGATDRQSIHYRMPAAVTNSTPVAHSPGWKRLKLAIGLPLRHEAELDRLLRELSDPGSPNYRHYLTPQQFTERFGPSEEDYDAVIRFAQAHHLTVTAKHPNRMVLDVQGLVVDVERAFNVKLRVYQHPTESRTFFAPESEPTVDAGLPVLAVSGLDNYTVPRPMSLKKLQAAPQAGTGSGPSGSLLGYDFRAAYVPGVALNGAGQTVGLLEFDSGYYQSDITKYENLAGLPDVPVQAVLLDGYGGGPGDGNDEVSLDIEMAISMAPGLSEVLVYEGSLTDDILSRIATDNLAKQIGASWTYGIDATSEQLFKEMIAQGQSFYNASGDSDAYTGTIPSPSDDTNIICVGGTTLTTTGPQGSWVSETVWNWDNGEGSSGGISTVNKIPIWQTGISMTANQGSTTMRNLPDVAMPANNIYVTYSGGEAGIFGGTSCATPLWAAFTALANQLAITNGEPTVGFINPAVYAIGKGSNVFSYASLFHDITNGNNESATSPTKFSAVPGYDLCTGWGSPSGSNLLTALAIPEPLRITPMPGVIISGPAGGPFTPASAGFSLTNGGQSAFSWSLINTSVWFNLAPTSGTLTHGGTSAVVAVTLTATASNLPAGGYTATILFSNQNDHFAQSRQATLAVVTPPVITSQPANQAVLWGATATFSVSTAPEALLYYQWQMNGTNLSDGGQISGSSASSLSISNANPTNVASYSVIVSNAAGVQVSSNALLTIVPSAPVITAQPTNLSVLPGAPAAFAVAAVGNHPFTYQWRLNGTNLAGATSTAVALGSAWSTNTGTYSVVVSNSLGSTTSTGAVLSLFPVTAPGLTLASLYSFPTNDLSGDTPYSALTQAKDGKLYGTAVEGGTNGYGTIFRVTTNGVFNALYSFNYTAGGILYAGLVQGSDSYLYGVAADGGSSGDGTVFRLTTNATGFSTLFTFSGVNGDFPVAGMVQGTDGYFYGTTYEGGVYGYGTIFKITSGGARTTLLSFDESDGVYPSGVLVQGTDGNFYGTAEEGGTNGAGLVFKITPGGSFTMLYCFSGLNDGAVPTAGLVQGLDGNFYGTTIEGGSNDMGTVFRITPAGALTSLYSFTGTNDGANPWSGLVQSSDGNFYGTTEAGGPYSDGTVFRISSTGDFATMVAFDGYEGSTPLGALTQGADGNLYGTTGVGGAGNYGTIFQLRTGGALQITGQPQDQSVFQGGTARFTVATFGSLPVTYQWQEDGTNLVDGGNISGSATATLTITNASSTNVALYSVIVSNAYGAVVSDDAFLELLLSPPQITSQPVSQNLVQGETAFFNVQAVGDLPLSFQWRLNGTNLSDGGQISGSLSNTLAIASVTPTNAGNYSVVVRNGIGPVTSAAAALSVLPVSPPGAGLGVSHLFTAGTDGAFPYANLIQGKDGYLYGAAAEGGSKFYGELFRMTLAGVFSSLYSFTNGNDGALPYAALVQASNGYLYGTTLEGGSNGYGAIFRTAPGASVITPLYSFTDGNDGAYCYSPLVQGSDGNLYGTAFEGGTNSLGTVFKMTTNGVVTPLYSFTGGNDGSYPVAGLAQAANGNYYGTAEEGGADGYGTVFAVSAKGALVNALSFDYTNGAYPEAALVQASDGSFYGTTPEGGAYGYGTVFRLTTNGALAVVVSFNYTNGANPVAALVLGDDGNFYGTTATGGAGSYGTAFKLATNGVLTTLVSFDGLNGAYPEASLVQANSGNFYGTTVYGGTGYNGTAESGQGTIFELTVPVFDKNPFTMGIVTAGLPYSASLAAYADTVSGDTLSFAKVSGPAWLIVATNGLLSGTPANSDIGTNTFVVSLTDTNGLSATATMLVTVLAPVAPSFSPNPFTLGAFNEGQPVSGSIAGMGVNPNPGDALQFGLVSGPAWLTVATNGTVAGTPGLSNVGTNTFVVSVTDLLGLSNTATMYLEVYGPPVFTNDPFTGPFAGVGLAFSNSIVGCATDPNVGNTLTYALVSGPSWLMVSNNGVLTGTPASTNAGTNIFVVSATDSGGLSVEATMYLYVYTPPSFLVKPFTGQTAISGIPYQGTIATNAAPDPDVVVGDTLSFRLIVGPSWLIVSTNGQLSGSPADSDAGTNRFTVGVSDSVGFGGSTRLNLNVKTDSPPFFLTAPFSLPDAKSGVAYPGTIATNATDPDLPYGDTLTFVKLSGPAWLVLSNNGTFGGTPGSADAGTNTFVISVRDYDGLSNNATMTLNVEGTPAFTSNPLTVPWANVDEAYTASVATNAVEPVAGATMLFSKLSGPSWLTVATNGALSGTPLLTNAGTNTYVLSVTDYRGLTNTATLYVYVNSPPAFIPDPFTKPQATAGVFYSGNIATNATDPDLIAGDTLEFYKVTGPAWLSVDTAGEISGTPSSGDIGTGSYLVLCVDSGGLAAVGTMEVQVAADTLAAPIQLSISRVGSQVNLSWTGGNPPYQVQTCTNLTGTNWINWGGSITSSSLSLSPSNAAAWFRVKEAAAIPPGD
jgi:uncharacterized repeat protein (TIGR03803 family)